MWPLGVLLLLAALLAIPVPTLTLTNGRTEIAERLDDGGTYLYSYVNSVYDAPVEELHVRRGDTLSITSASSPDIRAIEYYRWAGTPSYDGSVWQQRAPSNELERLTIRIVPRYSQRMTGNGWSIDLAAAFGDDVVVVAPTREPIGLAMLRGWRP